MSKSDVRKARIIYAREHRTPPEDRLPALHYYACRHPDNDMALPCTFEKSVAINYWGIALLDRHVLHGGESYINIPRKMRWGIINADTNSVKLDNGGNGGSVQALDVHRILGKAAQIEKTTEDLEFLLSETIQTDEWTPHLLTYTAVPAMPDHPRDPGRSDGLRIGVVLYDRPGAPAPLLSFDAPSSCLHKFPPLEKMEFVGSSGEGKPKILLREDSPLRSLDNSAALWKLLRIHAHETFRVALHGRPKPRTKADLHDLQGWMELKINEVDPESTLRHIARGAESDVLRYCGSNPWIAGMLLARGAESLPELIGVACRNGAVARGLVQAGIRNRRLTLAAADIASTRQPADVDQER